MVPLREAAWRLPDAEDGGGGEENIFFGAGELLGVGLVLSAGAPTSPHGGGP